MAGFSTYVCNKLLDHLLKTASYPVPTNIYVALSRADPLASGAGIDEPVGNAYARKTCNVWAAASAGAASNTNAVEFDEATGSWGTLTHGALYDASSGGNLLAFGPLTASKAIGNGDTARFKAGTIQLTLT